MKNLIKRLLPEWAKFFLYRYFWDPLRGFVWKRMNLRYTLRSGLTVELGSSADWEIYNEVLVNGEYDEAIRLVLKECPGRSLRVVDLGANVGYFVFRIGDLFLEKYGDGRELSITAVEGSPRVYGELSRRIRAEPLLAERVRLVNGLVGERSGSSFITESSTHYGNAIAGRKNLYTVSVDFVDLLALLDEQGEIDFLKCDIEGAEFAFVRNYPSLLQRVRFAVFEFHNYGEDVVACRERLRECGLVQLAVLRETPTFTIEFFGRDDSRRDTKV